jgi:hypothetical protein
MLRRVALVRIDVSEELIASIIRVERFSELGTLAVISCCEFPAVPSSLVLSLWWQRRYFSPKHLVLQEPHGVTSRGRHSSQIKQELFGLVGASCCQFLSVPLQARRPRVHLPMRSLNTIHCTWAFQPHHDPKVCSASNINEYQKIFVRWFGLVKRDRRAT